MSLGLASVLPERPPAATPSEMMTVKQLHLIIYETIICQLGLAYALIQANEENSFFPPATPPPPKPGFLTKLDHKMQKC